MAHLSNLAPNATLPSQSTCATLANQSNFPETTPENANDGTGWDANNQIWTTPSYFYANAGHNGLAPAADFAAVDGKYSGTTQGIIRWAACKWGVDEDWAYAETAEETGGWTNACAQMHGGSTCHEAGDCGNYDSDSGGEAPNLSFLGFPVTDSGGSFIGPNAYTGQNADGSTCSSIWSSWSIIQSKARFFEWYTWPMLAVSTAWGEDYRWAKYRACVNGDYATWFGNSSDYLNAVSRARSNPNGVVPSGQAGPVNLFTNETNMQYLGAGLHRYSLLRELVRQRSRQLPDQQRLRLSISSERLGLAGRSTLRKYLAGCVRRAARPAPLTRTLQLALMLTRERHKKSYLPQAF